MEPPGSRLSEVKWRFVGRFGAGPMELQGCWICPRVTEGPGFLGGSGDHTMGSRKGLGVSVTFAMWPRPLCASSWQRFLRVGAA